MTPTTAGIAEILEIADVTRRECGAHVSKSRILTEAPVLGHLVVNPPERNTAGQSNKESEEKRNGCGPAFCLRLVLQGTNNGVKSVHVEPDKNVN